MAQQPRRVIAAACDGACSGNPGPGGWGALLRFEDGSLQELGGADPATTNNRMELCAALALMQALGALPRHPDLVIRTDSRYLIDGLQKWLPGWKRKGWRTASGSPVLNRDLWEQLDRQRLADVPLVHVRGHSGDADNDRCDAIAVAFSRGQRPRLATAAAFVPAAAGHDGVHVDEAVRANANKGVAAGAAETTPEGGATQASGPGLAGRGARAKDQGVGAARGNGATGTRKGVAAPTEPEQGTPRAAAGASRGSGDQGQLQLNGTARERPDLAAAAAEPAPDGLRQLLSRLELADRLARGGYSLSLLELAQLVELPVRLLEERRDAWSWRDWLVRPQGAGRWRLERDAGGLDGRQ